MKTKVVDAILSQINELVAQKGRISQKEIESLIKKQRKTFTRNNTN